MPFLSNSSGFQITGGNFYEVAGDLKIQSDPPVRLALEDEDEGSSPDGPSTMHDYENTWADLSRYSLGAHGRAPSSSRRLPLQGTRLLHSGTGCLDSCLPPTDPLLDHEGNIQRPQSRKRRTLVPGPHRANRTCGEGARASIIINGGTFYTRSVTGEGGLNILHHATALGALHNSVDGFMDGTCLPGTRKEALDHLWRRSTGSGRRFLWLYGPAGTGKSAIARTFSERLDHAGRLGGCFFFKRGHPTCGNSKALFFTIAYQLALGIPGLRAPILRAVENNPSLVGRSMLAQLRQLILEPCQSFDKNRSPIVILIDGLDECEGQDTQQEVLSLLGQYCTGDSFPAFRFFIASRPEPHISESFTQSCLRASCSSLDVGQSFEDVRTYLGTEFDRIRREHRETMDSVAGFTDDKRFRPTDRLAAIHRNIRRDEMSPFAGFDRLYTQILAAIPDRPRLLAILCVVTTFKLSPRHIEQLLELRPGDRKLRRFERGSCEHGICVLQSLPVDLADTISVHHASFRDFLCDPTRSGEFYLGPHHITDLTRAVLRTLMRMAT
ncbi:putative nwd2 protein [Mycena venus]|uniref:Putative nwd2 protein n=1 Tax=Mycena venus TaxID=2733690 RepID=A0A8H6Y5Q8_9AGAR|nr:putative nwd2 protein [Mycena venus]